MLAVKSKLKIIAYRPEVQQTDMTSVYETCQKSQMRYVLSCHRLRIHSCLFSLLFIGNFQIHRLIFQKWHFSKFCKNFIFFKTQNVLLLFCYSDCHDSDHISNEKSLNIFIDNQFFPKNAILHFCPKNFALSSTLLYLLQS